MKQTVVFRCHTPFTIFTASIIGEIYYKDDNRVLLTSYGKNTGFYDRIVCSGLFEEVYSFKEDSPFVEDVEKEVSEFLEKYPRIDVFFTYLFSDRYSALIAHKVANKAKVCIMPEGSSVINFKERMEMLYQEAYGKIRQLKIFYEKYPLDLQLFSELWLYDEKMVDGELPLRTKEILFSQLETKDRLSLTKKMNILFDYQEDDLGLYDIIYLDDNLSERGWMYTEYERLLLEYFFHQTEEKKILVKPHPGQDISYEEQKFNYPNATIFSRPDIPWELLYINAMNANRENSVVIVSMWMSTAIYSSLKLTGDHNRVIVLSFVKMGNLYYNDLLEKSNELSSIYYEKIEDYFHNVRLLLPKDEDELFKAIEECFGIKANARVCLETVKNEHAVNYFKRVGNLFEHSFLIGENNIYKACYNYLGDICEAVFMINSFINFREFSWIPSLKNLYSSIKQMKIIVVDDSLREYQVYEASDLPILLTDTNEIKINMESQHYCRMIKIVFRGDIRNNFSQLANQNFDLAWRKDFWERWLEIVLQQKVGKAIEQKQLKNVAIYGCGKIGKKIYTEFVKYDLIPKMYEAKKKTIDGIDVYGLDNLSEETQVPDIFIVTPMNEYYQIQYAFPRRIRDKAISLETFLSFLEK